MERLVVDAEGKVTIPSEITHKYGLRPGDEVELLETGRGLVVCHDGLAWAQAWWNSLTEEDKRAARTDAEEYEALSEAERDAIWNEGDAELEKWLEGDDEDGNGEDAIDLSTGQRPVR